MTTAPAPLETTTLAPIFARGLVKRFGDLTAVDGVDLTVAEGTVLGLLGPNGAGKTTTIEMLEGLQTPTAGDIRILDMGWGRDDRKIRQHVGVQLQETQLPEKLTVQEILETFHSFYEKPRSVDEILSLVGLNEKRKERSVNLSGGQRQRLALGCALVSAPEILFLDEPTTGLDPQARRRVWKIVEDFRADGGTVLLTTHYMDEAERLADDLIIIDHGKIIASGPPKAIIESLGADSIISFSAEAKVDQATLIALPGVRSLREDAGRVELTVEETQLVMGPLLSALAEAGHEIEDLRIHRPNLEDVFVSLTGRHLRDE